MLFGPRIGKKERELLEELTLGDLAIGFLCSARSSHRMFKIARKRALERYRTRHRIEKLMTRGLIIEKRGLLSITREGMRALDTAVVWVRSSLAQKKWDKKWRVVTFDIPERLSDLRYQIRAILKKAGFQQLQRSVWVFPHECAELAGLMRRDLRVRKHVLYGVLERLDDSQRLEKLFFRNSKPT